jgi:hypothetical protein
MPITETAQHKEQWTMNRTQMKQAQQKKHTHKRIFK